MSDETSGTDDINGDDRTDEVTATPADATPADATAADATPADATAADATPTDATDAVPALEALDGHRNGTYDASAIQVLEGLEAVRKRPGMYIGSTGERGLHHLVLGGRRQLGRRGAGRATRTPSRSRSSPTAPSASSTTAVASRSASTPPRSKPAVEVVLTVLHAGGKFGGGGYAVSGGLHGVGVSVVNALSDKLDVEVRTDGYRVWRQDVR